MRIKILLIVLFLSAPLVLMAQQKPGRSSVREVLSLIDKDDYTAAAPVIEKLLVKYPDDPFLHLQAGICYLNIDYREIDAAKHLSIAEKGFPLSSKNDKNAIEAQFYLGQALHLTYDFDSALVVFNKLKAGLKSVGYHGEDLFKKIDREIRYNKNALKLIAHPVEFRITNLGAAVNSEYDEHSPVITADESMIIFTSNRPGTGNQVQPDGLYNEDIYFSEWREGRWLPAMNIGDKINTAANDATVSLSADGRNLLVYRNDGISGDLYISVFGNDGWSKLEKLPKPINSTYNETHGTFADEGRTIYFVSDRPGGFGGKDIYVSRKLPTGEWGKPRNLGSVVNTPEDEDSPFMHSDGRTLYFASEGHNSMGGYDVFYSVVNDSDVWLEPVNVGYPINTPDDDIFYVPTADGQRVYYASKRKGGFGRSDIYIIDFPDTDPRSLAVVAGYIFSDDGDPVADATIMIKKKMSDEVVGVYRPNPKTGKYIIILPVDEEYNMYVESDGFKSEKIDIKVPVREEFITHKRVLFLDPVVLEKE